MNRKRVVGILGAALVAAGVWWLWLRGPDRAAQTAKPAAADRSTALPVKPSAPPREPSAEQQRPLPRWSLDADPDGRLRLEGQVLDADGKGAGGAEVWLDSVPPRSARTDDDGTFSFDKLVGRTYSLTAIRGPLLGGPVRTKLTAESEPVVMRLAEAATVDVTVHDDGKRPIKDAEVKLSDVAERTARTDDKGLARLAPVRPGWVTVVASAAGYAPATGYVTVGSSGATGALALTLHKGYPVSGRVIDEAGKPVAGARITTSTGLFDAGSGDAAATTDPKGAFTIPALASGSYTLDAVDGEHEPAGSPPITVSGKPVDNVEIVMKAGGVLAGIVVDAARKPVPFATVRVTGSGQELWRAESRQATTDQRGQFELRGLARAKQQARAESDTAASKIVDVDLSSKRQLDKLELVLEITGTISGIVVDDRGQPVPEVQVNAFPDFLDGASPKGFSLAGLSATTTGGGGEFAIRGLPDGAYRVWAGRRSGGFGPWNQQATRAKPGDHNVRVTLPSPGALTGRVVLAGSAAPPRGVLVSLGFMAPTPATDGAFELKDLVPGSYDVTIRGFEFAELVRQDVQIEPGKTTELGTITVTRGRRLAGKVVDSSGAPVAGARIRVGAMLISMAQEAGQSDAFESMSGIRSTVTDQDGSFNLVGLTARTNHVMAEHAERGRSVALPVPGGDSDPPPVRLELRGFGSIVGKVTQQGKPVPNLMISESSKDGGAQGQLIKSSGDGSFVLPKVSEGTHIISATQPSLMSMKSTSVTVRVTAGKQTTANIEIPVGAITVTVQVKPKPGNQVDAAQLFLFGGTVNVSNGRQLGEGMFQSSMQGMKFWLGAGKPAPEFPELVAGAYSICALPITGDLSDIKLQRRMQENSELLKVYCKPAQVAPSPLTQAFEIELPAMAALPEPTK